MALPESLESFDWVEFAKGQWQSVPPGFWYDERPWRRTSEMILFLNGARYHPRAPHMEALSLRTGRTWRRCDPAEPD